MSKLVYVQHVHTEVVDRAMSQPNFYSNYLGDYIKQLESRLKPSDVLVERAKMVIKVESALKLEVNKDEFITGDVMDLQAQVIDINKDTEEIKEDVKPTEPKKVGRPPAIKKK